MLSYAPKLTPVKSHLPVGIKMKKLNKMYRKILFIIKKESTGFTVALHNILNFDTAILNSQVGTA